MSYTTHADSLFDSGAPVLGPTHLEARDNLIAVAGGLTGAPLVEVAWHELENVTLGSSGGSVTFTTDISGYRALRIIGGSKLSASSLTLRVQVEISASWSTCLERTLTNNAILVDAEINNIDGDEASGYVITTLRLADFNIVSGDWNASAFTADGGLFFGYRDAGTAPTAVRLTLTTGSFTHNADSASFTLFGVKRTQP